MSAYDESNLTFAELYASDERGIYIPQFFAQSVKRAFVTGVSGLDWGILEAGPDHPDYWETWTDVLDTATINHPELGECFLYQDGDLWIVPAELPEELNDETSEVE